MTLALATVDFTPPPDGGTTYALNEVASDQTSTRAEVNWRWNPPVRRMAYQPSALYCRNTCRGMVHFDHKICDASCDTPCEKSHRESVSPARGFFTYTADRGATMQEAASQFGFDGDIGQAVMISSLEQGGITAAEENPALRVNWDLSCWNDDPCSTATKQYDELVFKVDFFIKLHRLNQIEGKIVRTEGPSIKYYVELTVPIKDSLRPHSKYENCRCQLVPDHASANEVDQIPETAISVVEDDGDTRVATGQEIKDMNFQVPCNDMGNALVTLGSPLENCSMVKIPAGWEFDCVDGSAQDTQLVNDLSFDCSSPLFATTTAVMAPKPQAKANTMCLEIKKKEPNNKLKYRLKPPSTLARLKSARLAADARRYGTAVQVRTWIITDHASFTEISKLLVPAPAPAMYLRELHTAQRIGAINPAEPKAKVLYDNELLSTPGLEPEPMEDFVKAKLTHDREATMKWARTSGAKSFADWFEGNETAVVAKALDAFVTRFAQAGDDGRLAVAEMLASRDLAPHLDALQGDGISALAARLTQPADAKLAEALVLALERTKHPSAHFAALNAHKSLSAGLRSRLEKIR